MPPVTRLLPLVANVVGLLLLIGGALGLVATAFAVDPRAGWAVVSVTAIGAGWRLATKGEG